LVLFSSSSFASDDLIQKVIDATKPLSFPRGERLPLYIWPASDPSVDDEAKCESLLKQLDARGISAFASWSAGDKEKSLDKALKIAKLQKKLGLEVAVNASSPMYAFFNGDERTAHIDKEGKPFFDDSFGNPKMGCPFALDFRIDPMRERMESFLEAYKKAGIDIDFIFADWEIDGPIEWNDAWGSSKDCKRCRENIPQIDDFKEFQKSLRTIRSELQRKVFAEPALKRFPKARVANYGVYPDGGERYWFDYFETLTQGEPFRAEQKAQYRSWYPEFAPSKYSCAMPVVYTWYRIYKWYDFANEDYRWFYNMMLTVDDSGKHTAENIPSIPFVHWHTTAPPAKAKPVKQMSERAYQELLWHALLRNHDSFFLWCENSELEKEAQLLHEVYAASLEYSDFLLHGKPMVYDLPSKPGSVVSAISLENKLLVRRTDFEPNDSLIAIEVNGKKIKIPPAPGKCQIIAIP